MTILGWGYIRKPEPWLRRPTLSEGARPATFAQAAKTRNQAARLGV